MRPEELSKRTHLENFLKVACIVEFDSRETAVLYAATCCGLRSTFHRAERARPSTASIYRGPSLSPKGICTCYVLIKFIIPASEASCGIGVWGLENGVVTQ